MYKKEDIIMHKDAALNFFEKNLKMREEELKKQQKALKLYRKRLNLLKEHCSDIFNYEQDGEDEDAILEEEIIRSIKFMANYVRIDDISYDSKNYLKSIGCKIENYTATWDITKEVKEKYCEEYNDRYGSKYCEISLVMGAHYVYVYFLKMFIGNQSLDSKKKEAFYDLFTKKYIENSCNRYEKEYAYQKKIKYEEELSEFKEKYYNELINFPVEQLLVDYKQFWKSDLERVEIIYNETLEELGIDEKYKTKIYSDEDDLVELILRF